jgi:hypothetical protein
MLKLWKFTYLGYYPVGAGGVVIAKSKSHAKALAEKAIREHGQEPQEVEVEPLTGVFTQPGGWVILDGNY